MYSPDSFFIMEYTYIILYSYNFFMGIADIIKKTLIRVDLKNGLLTRKGRLHCVDVKH